MISTPSARAAAVARSPASTISAPGGLGTAGPDYLRVESFGALYYARQTSTYHSLPPRLTDILTRAREQSAIELFAARPELLGIDDAAFAGKVVAWQEQGFLDADYRCPAELIWTPRARRTLSAPLVTSLFVTLACNLRCAHCFVSTYKGKPRDGLPLDRMVELFTELERAGAPELIVMGGEPLLRPDIFELLEEVDRHHLNAVLSTNGVALDAEAARRLAAITLSRVQVSIDGPDAAAHDAVRGAGTFEKALRGVRASLEAGVPHVALRVTVTARDLDRLVDFVRLADALGVHSMSLKPLKQIGEASGAGDMAFTPAALRAAIERALPGLKQARCEVKTSDGMPERMPVWTGVQPPFSCTGGTVRAVVLADGRVVACAAVTAPDDWTLYEHGFLESWRHAPSILRWRQLAGNETCRTCERFERCAGGCRARALGHGDSLDEPDPWAGCP